MEQVLVEEPPPREPAGEDAPALPIIQGSSVPLPYSNEHLNVAAYTVYAIDTTYGYDSGIRVLPTSGTMVGAAKVRVHQGFQTKTVTWTAERVGKEPDIPDTDTGDPDDVLIEANMTPCNPMQQLDKKIWRISGVYIYARLKPKIIGQSKFPVGTTPAEIERSSARSYGPAQVKKDIIDAGFAREGVVLRQVIRT